MSVLTGALSLESIQLQILPLLPFRPPSTETPELSLPDYTDNDRPEAL